jgi:hypothetical protein
MTGRVTTLKAESAGRYYTEPSPPPPRKENGVANAEPSDADNGDPVLEPARTLAAGAHIDARMFVKGVCVDGGVGALRWPAVVPVVSRSGFGGHDRDEPPTGWWGQARSKSHRGRSGNVRRRGRQVIRCTTTWCEPVRSGQAPTGVTQVGRGSCL